MVVVQRNQTQMQSFKSVVIYKWLSGKSGLSAFTDGAVGTSKVTSSKCMVSIENEKRFEYRS